jgi:hypothetical protein
VPESGSFKSVFIAVFLSASIVTAAFLINRARPAVETTQPSAALVKATGKCAECHRRETSAIVHQFERSRHAAKNVTCLDCHQPAPEQEHFDHNGFVLANEMTSKNCAACHSTEYDQFTRSRHAGPAWAAVSGAAGFSDAQIAQAEGFHPGTIERPANQLAILEGEGAIEKGCGNCHAVGKPNADGSFGTCTHCHSRHNASIAVAREPSTCGQCHMGPDHSQIEIFTESKHGVLFAAEKASFDLTVPSKSLTTRELPVPTCSTCHMSGLEGMKVTHDVTERLSWYLFADVSDKRPGYDRGQREMKELCRKCHAASGVQTYFEQAEVVVKQTNAKVRDAKEIVASLRRDGLLTKTPFDEPIEFVMFDLWHYYGRTAKHGAFMGGADFVQWHGIYELLRLGVELKAMADEIRHSTADGTPPVGGRESKPEPKPKQDATDPSAG